MKADACDEIFWVVFDLSPVLSVWNRCTLWLMVAESRAFFLDSTCGTATLLGTHHRPPSLQLPSPGQCVQRSHHSGRGSRPKKRVFGAEKGDEGRAWGHWVEISETGRP